MSVAKVVCTWIDKNIQKTHCRPFLKLSMKAEKLEKSYEFKTKQNLKIKN